MNAREFVDTNVFIYAFDLSAGRKRTAAMQLVERLWSERAGGVSLQILQEFYVTATRKLAMPAGEAALQVARLGKWTVYRPAFDDITSAIDLHRRKQVSFWDALVLHSAMKLGCSILWSEDLAGGQKFGDLTVRDPFAA